MFNFTSTLQHNYSKIYRVILVGITVFLMMLISPKTSRFQYEFEEGFPWVHQTLFAPFSFAIDKTQEQINLEKNEVISSSYLYFDVNKSIADTVKKNFSAKAALLFANDSTITIKDQKYFLENGNLLIHRLYEKGIVSVDDDLLSKPDDYVIKAIDDHAEKQLELQSLFTISQAYDSIKVWTKNLPDNNLLAVSVLENIKPNITYNKKLTTEILDQKLSILSPVYGLVNKGEKIVDRGDIITTDIYQKLFSLEEASIKKTGSDDSQWYIYGGILIYVAFAILMLILIIKMFSPAVYYDTNSFTLILILFILSFGMATLPRFFPAIEMYALPFALFAVILQSFFRSSLASIVYMLMVFIGGVVATNGIEFLWIEIPSGLLAILLLKNLRKRSQFLGVVMVVFISSSLLYFASSLVKEGHLDNIEPEKNNTIILR